MLAKEKVTPMFSLQAIVGRVECPLGERQQFLSRLGQYHLVTVPLEQGLLEFVLQLQNLMGEGALADEQLF